MFVNLTIQVCLSCRERLMETRKVTGYTEIDKEDTFGICYLCDIFHKGGARNVTTNTR